MKKIIASILLSFAVLSFAAGCGYAEPTPPETAPRSVPARETEKQTGTENPDTPEKTDPTGTPGLEALLKIEERLKGESNYSSAGYSRVDTAVLFFSYKQEVWTYKDCKDGVMIQTDIAKSTFVNSAWQTCFIPGRAIVRGPASSSAKDWNGRETEWSGDEPAVYTEAEYNAGYGLFGTELSVYLLDADTVDFVSDVVENGDGCYSLTVTPNVEKATSFYRARMKTMGGLSSLPEFHGVKVTFTFDRSWRLLSSHTEEAYSVKLGVISSDDCRAVTDVVYSYGDADVGDYDGYFAAYTG